MQPSQTADRFAGIEVLWLGGCMSSHLDLLRQYTTIVADTDDFVSIREHTPQDDANNVNPSAKRMKTLVSSAKGSGMKLNPNWVEQLMGLPAGWTQLPAHWLTG